jgi:Tfp pilus assembly protein PilE
MLGILAAIAIPKFLDLQTQSANNALKSALAEGSAQVSMGYSHELLKAGRDVSVTLAAANATSNYPKSEEFEYDFTPVEPSAITVEVGWKLGKKPSSGADNSITKLVVFK